MHHQIIVSSEVERVPLNLPGAALQVLHNEAGGGMTAVAHLAPGTTIPEHWHTHAEETLYMLSGDLVIAGVPYGPGTFFVVSAGTKHGPHSTVHGCTMLTRFSAELDFRPVE